MEVPAPAKWSDGRFDAMTFPAYHSDAYGPIGAIGVCDWDAISHEEDTGGG